LNDPDRRIPRGHIISRQECLHLFPDLEKKNLTGAGVFYDAQMYNPPRLALSYLRSAIESGAQAANYLEAIDFLRKGDRVVGVKVRDRFTCNEFEIRGKVVLNSSGPWAEGLLESKMGITVSPEQTYSRDACFVIPRRLTAEYALAVQGRTSDPDAVISRKHRHLFIAPWRDYTLIGVWHVVFKGSPDEFTVTNEELQDFIDEVNQGYPSLDLKLEDVSMWNAGIVLFGKNKPGADDLSYGKRSLLIDHAKKHNVQGLITLIGVRATTARGKALKAVDVTFKKLGRNVPKSKTDVTPIYGGQIECFEEFLSDAIEKRPSTLDADVMRPLLHNYGSRHHDVLKYIKEDHILAEKIGTSKVIKAEIIHAVREEMAQKLVDVVFRRTDLGTGGYPGDDALKKCADLMAAEMGWNDNRIQQEVDEVRSAFPFLNKSK